IQRWRKACCSRVTSSRLTIRPSRRRFAARLNSGDRQQGEIDMTLPTKRKQTTHIGCACGQTRLELEGDPILVSECLCNSCRAAAVRLAALPGAKNILTSYGATACAEYRKDRVQFLSGTEHLKEFRLS